LAQPPSTMAPSARSFLSVNFVLVHGSGGGAWAWDQVQPLLEQEGHRVVCPSLPGMDDPATALEDHVAHVAQTVVNGDLTGVHLVGHSYGGMPITGAAERVPERIARLVYLDAFAPRDGQSAFDTRPDLDSALRPGAQGGLLPPLDPWFAGVDTEEQAQRLRRLLTTTPLRVLTDRIELRNPAARRIPRSFVFCTRSGFAEIAGRARAAGWDYHELEAGHMAMEVAPRAVADLLCELAAADEFNAFEATGWEAKAAGYDGFLGQITQRFIEPLLDAAGVRGGARVLDVASGPGYATARAAERGASVIGVDIAQGMVALARERYPQLDFRWGDAESLPFTDDSFDSVLASFLMHHVSRYEQVAEEFARVLAPGGRLALTVWDLPERARFIGVLLDAVAEVGASPPADVPPGPPFFRFSEGRELGRLLGDQGLGDFQMERVSFTHPVESPDDLWRGLLESTVRTAALMDGQSADVQGQIRASFERLVEQYRGGPGLEIPVSAIVASARKTGP
jgi:SAM-dependent methyltransferase/pimeloyl-ACP methyl ester carboxylesterase